MSPSAPSSSNIFSRNLLTRSSPFSYGCARCCRCCHDKIIRLSPFEVAAMANQCGIGTAEFIDRYTVEEGTTLRFTKAGRCMFLSGQGCAVHASRPLACRLYPLNRHTSGIGWEFFSRAIPHPESEGVYGGVGTVADYLENQGALGSIAAADRFIVLFGELYAAYHGLSNHADKGTERALATVAPSPLGMRDWLDMDRVVADHCREQELPFPGTVEEKLELYLREVRKRISSLAKEAP